MDAVESEAFARPLHIKFKIPWVDFFRELINLTEGESCEAGWVSKMIPKVAVGCKSEVRGFSPNCGDNSSFRCVNNISGYWGEVASDTAQRIAHESTAGGHLLQRLTYDIEAVVHEAIFDHPMERFLDVDEFRTGEQSDEGESMIG